MASALDILRALSPDQSLAGGIVEVAELRGLTPLQELNQLLGKEPDILAQQERSAEGLIDDPAFLGAVEIAGKLISGFFTGGIAPALITLGKEAGHDTVDQGDLLKAGRRIGTSYLTQGAVMDDFDFFDSFSDAFSGFDAGVFGDVSLADVFNVATPLVAGFLTPNQGLPAVMTSAAPVRTQVPAVIPTQAVSRSFFNRFPNLATVMQALKNSGRKVTANGLYGKLVQFGVPALMGVLTSVVSQEVATNAVHELALRGHKHRRMNPCNAKALRRAARRIKGFHNMCRTIDLLKTRKRKC